MANSVVASVEQRRSGAQVIKLAGSLDERAALGAAITAPLSGKMLINLSGVNRINSIGAREWINWLTTLERAGTELALVYCSPAVVAQLNRIKDFAGKSIVKSFQAPYHCASCDVEKLHVVYVADLGEPPFTAPQCTCEGCGSAMTFTEDAQAYFGFLEQQTKRLREAIGRGSNPHLASRDSVPTLSAEQVAQISAPRASAPLLRDSRPSLSAFQTGQRSTAGQDVLTQPPQERRLIATTVAIAMLVVIAFVLLTYWIAS